MPRKRKGTVIMPAPTPPVLAAVPAVASAVEPQPTVVTEPRIQAPRSTFSFLTDAEAYFNRGPALDSHTTFSAYLHGQLCRAVYYEFNPDEYAAKLKDLFGIVEFRRFTSEANPAVAVDRWRFAGGTHVYAFRGTSDLSQMLDYLNTSAIMERTGGEFPDWVSVYKGLRSNVDALSDLVVEDIILNARTGLASRIVLTGHSLGAAAAFATAVYTNGVLATQERPVNAVVTFGEPEYFRDNALATGRDPAWTMTPGFWKRAYLRPGDPVCFAAAAAAAVNRGVLPQHYATAMDDCSGLEPGQPVWTLLDDAALGSATRAARLAVLVSTEAETWKSRLADRLGVSNHLMHNYTNLLESHLRHRGYTPYPLFTHAVKAARFLDGLVPDA